jgi:hypothetical protein
MKKFDSHLAKLWDTLVEYGSAVNVSALTTLLAFTDYGSLYRALAFYGEFTTNGGRIIATPSHGGIDACPSGTKFDDVTAAQEAHVFVGDPNEFTNWQFAAQSDNPGVTTASLRWALLGLPR